VHTTKNMCSGVNCYAKIFLPRRNRTPKFNTPDVRTPDSGTLTGALLVSQ